MRALPIIWKRTRTSALAQLLPQVVEIDMVIQEERKFAIDAAIVRTMNRMYPQEFDCNFTYIVICAQLHEIGTDNEGQPHVQNCDANTRRLQAAFVPVSSASAVRPQGACGYNRPCAHQYVGTSQSCML